MGGAIRLNPVRYARAPVDLVPWTVPLTAGPTCQFGILKSELKRKRTIRWARSSAAAASTWLGEKSTKALIKFEIHLFVN